MTDADQLIGRNLQFRQCYTAILALPEPERTRKANRYLACIREKHTINERVWAAMQSGSSGTSMPGGLAGAQAAFRKFAGALDTAFPGTFTRRQLSTAMWSDGTVTFRGERFPLRTGMDAADYLSAIAADRAGVLAPLGTVRGFKEWLRA